MRNVGIEAERPNLPKPDAVVSAAEVVGDDADVDAALTPCLASRSSSPTARP